MNKFYIQNVFFLLIIFVYLNNKTLATESAPGKDPAFISTRHCPTSEEIHVKNKHILCTNPEEIKNADELMNEAVKHLEYHAKNEDGYKYCRTNSYYKMLLYKKKHQGHTDVEKIQYTVDDPNMYNEVINRLWNPDCDKLIDTGSVKRKFVRAYNPNLVIMQQRYKKSIFGRQKYFYALATKAEISEDITIIAMTSANIIDHNPSNIEYKNTIVENANFFKTEIDSEEDIRKGKLKKTFVNIAGYLIEKKSKYVDVTFIASVRNIQILII
ncbi:fam-a protein [Plasmodium vinckei lentum]|uniref:Fam-a protein n=1 Tax=Plasmodium vinckei lentum TaxID=138297 RepID=A0A6V7SKN9_PLAVN|nr:fam-a protein [Plasmodium vinckei lentum]